MYKTLAAALFLLSVIVLITATQQSSPERQPPVAQTTPEPVMLAVTVTNDKGELVSGLKQEHFSVFVGKAPAKIDYFSDQDVPVSIGILFDASGSIKAPNNSKKLRALSEALSGFMKLGNKSNEYFVIGFNDRPQLLLDWTSDPKAIIDTLSVLQPYGNTALHDAVALGLGKVLQGLHRKHAILLISDGQDNVSRHTFRDLEKLLKDSNVLVYSLNIYGSDEQGSALGLEGKAILAELSAASGGITFNVKSKTADVNTAFEWIARELRYQYTIGIAPASSEGKRKWNNIKVRITPPNDGLRKMKLSARSRQGITVPI